METFYVGREYRYEDIAESIRKKIEDTGNGWTVEEIGSYHIGKQLLVYEEITGIGVMSFLLTGANKQGIYKLVY